MRSDLWLEWANHVTEQFLDAALCAGAEVDVLETRWNHYSRGMMFSVNGAAIAKSTEGEDVLYWSAHGHTTHATGWCAIGDLPAGTTPESIIREELANPRFR